LGDTLADAVRRDLDGRVTLGPADTGLRVAGRLSPSYPDDRAVSARAADRGLFIPALSSYYQEPDSPSLPVRPSGLVFGYAGLSPAAIRQGIQTLADVL